MRVGLDLLFLEPGRTGGRETYARELLAALRAERPDLAFVAYGGEDLRDPDGWWHGCDEVVVLRGVRAASRASWARAEVGGLARARVDVVHGLANFGPLFGAARRVLTVHDVLFAQLPEAVPLASRLPTAALMRAAARRADAVIAVSAASAADARRVLGVDEVVVVPNGVTPPVTAGDAARGRALAGAERFALCVASHLPHKDLALLPDDVVKAGTGTEVLPNGLGAVSWPELEDLYAAADALVTPTRFEGFGLPVLDALLRGLPVACTDLPVLREVAGPHATYFPAGDALACRAAIAVARSRPKDEPAVRAHAKSFTWSRAARATAAVYDRVVAG